MGEPGRVSPPPLNLVGDFGGGSMFLAFGIMSALWERERSGKGQVVDAAIVDGVTSMMTMFAGLTPSGRISIAREENLLGGAAPFYRCYMCADGAQISLGPLEPKFYAELLERIDAPDALKSDQYVQSNWAERSGMLAAIFAQRPAADWTEILEGTDACFAPVLPLEAAPHHPHMRARRSHVEYEGLLQAAPAPRFSRTPGALRPAQDAELLIDSWGV